MQAEKQKQKTDHSGHRLRRRKYLLKFGATQMSEVDLLEMLLFYSVPRADTRKLAEDMVKKFGSIEAILNANCGEIAKIPGLKDGAEALFVLIREVVRREGNKICEQCDRDPENIKKLLISIYKDVSEEQVYALYFGKDGMLISKHYIFGGDISSVRFALRTVTEGAIRAGASGVVLAHNHPSGSLIPSNDDILTTRRMAVHLAANEIELIEHYIVGKSDCIGIINVK